MYLAVAFTAILASHPYLRNSAMQLKSTTPTAGRSSKIIHVLVERVLRTSAVFPWTQYNMYYSGVVTGPQTEQITACLKNFIL